MTQNNFFDSMLYHKIARDKSFCNELYPCAPIVRLVIFSYLFRVDNPVDHYLAYCIIQNLFHGALIIISKFQKKGKKGPRKKPEITNIGGGGTPDW